MTAYYEWVIEELEGPDSEDVEVIDVDHADGYAEAITRAARHNHARIGLVRDTEDCRAWAYVSQGVLPEWLEDAYQRPVVKVPMRYRRQFDNCK